MKKKAVIFDWGGVLIDNPTSKIITYLSNYFGVDKKNFIKFYRDNCDKSLQIGISEEEIWGGLCKTFNIEIKNRENIWKEAVKNCFVERKEVWDFVIDLRKKGYKTGFLSNTEKGAVEYFLENNYDKFFDVAVYSCNEGIRKPDEKIYRITLERLGVNAKEAVFVDDREENIKGAEKIGMEGILFKNIDDIDKISAII